MLHSEDVVQKKDSNLVFRLLELGLLDGDNNKMDDGEGEDAAVPAVAWWGETPPKRGEVHRWVQGSYASRLLSVSLMRCHCMKLVFGICANLLRCSIEPVAVQYHEMCGRCCFCDNHAVFPDERLPYKTLAVSRDLNP